jgi:uncharacterized membrane protein
VVTAAGLVGALACAAYVSSVVLLPDATMREAARHPLPLVANGLAAVAFTALAVSLPLPGAGGRLPRWALAVTAAGSAAVAGVTWVQATVQPHFADLVGDEDFQRSSAYLDALWLPKIVLCAVGLAGLAVAAWRRRALPRGAAALLGAAAVVSLLPPVQPGALLAGLALAWTARSLRIP